MHSGNWLSAHELVLSAIAQIVQATGYSTNRGKRVPNSLGLKCGDLEPDKAFERCRDVGHHH
jgi:hypothetical protein